GFRLVRLDMEMAVVVGIAVCRPIRGQRVEVDIIAVTAARGMQIVQEALSYGVAQYIIKPFAFPVFKSELEAYSSFRNRLGGDSNDGVATEAEVDQAVAALRAHAAAAPGTGVPDAVQPAGKRQSSADAR